MSIDKIAQYKQEIEKVASRAWKRNLGKIGEKGVEKLMESGVFNRNKELKGLRRGTKAILGKEKAKMFRNPEHGAAIITRDAMNTAKKTGYTPTASDIDMTKKQVKGVGVFGAPDIDIKGFKHKGLITVPKNGLSTTRKVLNPMIEETRGFGMENSNKLKALKGHKRSDREGRKWTQAIIERHEADEVRMGNKILKNKKKTVDIGNGKQPVTSFASHISPKVVMAESSHVALAPKSTQDRMKHMRNWNAPVSGKETTEIGSLKKLSGKEKFQYGKDGAYNKKLANKIEKKTIRTTKDNYRDMGLIK